MTDGGEVEILVTKRGVPLIPAESREAIFGRGPGDVEDNDDDEGIVEGE